MLSSLVIASVADLLDALRYRYIPHGAVTSSRSDSTACTRAKRFLATAGVRVIRTRCRGSCRRRWVHRGTRAGTSRCSRRGGRGSAAAVRRRAHRDRRARNRRFMRRAVDALVAATTARDRSGAADERRQNRVRGSDSL